MPKRSAVAVLTTTSALVAAALAAAPSATATQSPRAIANTRPAWLDSATKLGSVRNSAPVHARVYLAPRGGFSALEKAAVAVSTPGSARYGSFLTAAQYHAAYDPASSTVAAVRNWLTSSGLRVTGTGAHGRYLRVTGTVAAAENAFGTRIARFRKSGRTFHAPTSALKAPAALASSVLTVTGVNTASSRVAPKRVGADVQPPAGFRNARPCSLYYGQLTARFQKNYKTRLPKFGGQYLPYAPCGYTGSQFRAAYEHNSKLDGTGITVAITDAYAAPTIRKDAEIYADRHGDGSYGPGQYTQTVNRPFRKQKQCDPSGWAGEQTLDVEAVHAMAPAAKIRYYGSASCYDSDFLNTLAKVVDEDRAQLVSNSWGDLEQNEPVESIRAYEQIFLQGAMEGIAFLFSSGDNGDELANSGVRQADYPTSDPYVTAVGGTSDAIGANGGFRFQTGWGTHKYSLSDNGKSWTPLGFLYGAGGGPSALFNKPAYQRGVAPGTYRVVPDVAMDADPNTGMLIGETQAFPNGTFYSEYRIGGTSLASPLLAGMTALAFQKRGGTGVGLLNPTIYRHAGSAAFRDIAGSPKDRGVVRVDYANGINAGDGYLYSVRTFNQDSSLRTNNGWDDVTGVGTPKRAYLSIYGR